MKQQARNCVFCNGPMAGGDVAKEHILPRWLLKALDLERHFLLGLHSGIPWGKVVKSERIQSFGSLVFGRVCKDCNGGWMSQLETAAMPVLTELMSESLDSASLDQNSRTVLAQWSFKTSAMLNLGSNYRQIVPSEHLQVFYQTKEPPRNCVVDLALGPVETEHLWMQGPFALLEVEGDSEFLELVVKHMASLYVITLNINGVLLRVVGCPLDSCEVLFPEDLEAVRLWPIGDQARQVTVSRTTTDVGDFHISTKLRVKQAHPC